MMALSSIFCPMELSTILARLDSLPSLLESIRSHYSPEDHWLLKAEEKYLLARQALEKAAVAIEDGLPSDIDLSDVRFLELLDKLKPDTSPDSLNEMLEHALIQNNVDAVEFLLKDGRAKINNDTPFLFDSQKSEIVKLFLEARDSSGRLRVDPSARDNAAIRSIVRYGFLKGERIEVLKLLLEARDDSGRLSVDPSTNDNEAIRIASMDGLTETVKLLLEARDDLGRPRVDPSARNNEAIRFASTNGRLEVVKLLLEARDASGRLRVDPSAKNNEAIRFALENRFMDVVKVLKPHCKMGFFEKLWY